MQYLGAKEGTYSYVLRKGVIIQSYPRAGSVSVRRAVERSGLEHMNIGLSAAKAFREWFGWPVVIVMRDPLKRARSCWQFLEDRIGPRFFELSVFEAEVGRANDHACPVSWWWKPDEIAEVVDIERPRRLLEILGIDEMPHEHKSDPARLKCPPTVLKLYSEDAELFERAA